MRLLDAGLAISEKVSKLPHATLSDTEGTGLLSAVFMILIF